ncbi:MAG: EF-P beta-lysylation protein EpmB [Pirellulaceae bacterium]
MNIVPTPTGSGSSASHGKQGTGGSRDVFVPNWTEAMRTAIRSGAELARFLDLPQLPNPHRGGAEADFPVFVPRGFAEKMEPGNPHDPLLRQVWPDVAETASVQGFTDDPVGDLAATLRPGVLQKYHGRALLVVSPACAIHCRYCFRRHFPYHEGPKGLTAWEEALTAIRADMTIGEVILSGGDPLTVVDPMLRELVERIAAIPHVRRLRVHTRLPIVIPARVTGDLIHWLTGTRLQGVMVVHANHPLEVDAEVLQALGKVRAAGVPVMNQSVLLRGVNDDAETLIELSERLIDGGVLPYYLHQLDQVRGAAHFEVDRATGRQLIETMRARLPGYGVPRYVEEIAGDVGKRVL